MCVLVVMVVVIVVLVLLICRWSIIGVLLFGLRVNRLYFGNLLEIISVYGLSCNFVCLMCFDGLMSWNFFCVLNVFV